jgi:outer-membrane receptor for ferric coprogen and ferric-rhodotorulic acid
MHCSLNVFAVAVAATWTISARAQSTVSSSGNPLANTSTLSAVQITSSRDADPSTEGSESYSARVATVAGKAPQTLQEIPNSVSVITRQRMDDQNMSSLQDALQYATGVKAVSYGNSAYYSARGYLLGIQFDGVSLMSGIQYQQQLDLAFYDRVEVFRGPAGLMAGTGDPGGTVNMVRKRPLNTFQFQTEAQVSTFGGIRQVIDVTGPMNKDGTLRGRAVIVGDDNHQFIDRSRKKEAGVYGILEYDIAPRTTVALSAAHQVNADSGYDYGVGGLNDGSRLPAPWSQNYGPNWNYTRVTTDEANLNLTHKFGGAWRSSTTVLYRRARDSATDAYPFGYDGDNPYEQDYFAESGRYAYNWFGVDTNVSGPVRVFGRDHILTFGANYDQAIETFDTGGADLGTRNVLDAADIPKPDMPLSSSTKYRYTQGGIYGQARIRILDPLTLILGAREVWYQENSRSNGADYSVLSRMNGKFIPYAGIVYDIVPSLSAYASYSTIFAPQKGATIGGQGIQPASGRQYEAGLKGSFMNGRLSATVAAFRIDNNHYALGDPVNPNFYVDAGKVRSQGWEAEISGEPLPGWNIYAGYTLLNTDYLSGGDSTGQSFDSEEPHSLFKLWTSYRFSQDLMRGWMIGAGMYAQSAASRLSSVYEQGGYAVFNTQIAYQFNKHVSASLSFNNMFNRRYYSRTPGPFFGQVADGRNALLTVRTVF